MFALFLFWLEWIQGLDGTPTVDSTSADSRGFFDSRPVVFYLSLTVFVLFLTFHVFQSRRWRN